MGERRVVEILPCDIPTEIPILPLASTVVFPSTVVSLQVVREKNLNLIRQLAVDDIIGIVVQKESTVEIPPPSELTEMGVAARLANRINLTPTTVQLILIGIIRFRVDAYLQTHPFLRARVSCLEIHEPDDASSTQLVQESVRKLETLVEVDPRVPEETLNLIRNNLQGPGHLADQLSEYLNFQVRQKIEILQCVNPLERLQIANGIMSRQIAFG
ncbi:MAG: LON peptidase substrate-binding domain-containing protein, partial [Acidobacteriota bacterium]